jgi:hypothetical protein
MSNATTSQECGVTAIEKLKNSGDNMMHASAVISISLMEVRNVPAPTERPPPRSHSFACIFDGATSPDLVAGENFMLLQTHAASTQGADSAETTVDHLSL